MFDFEKLKVFDKAKSFNRLIRKEILKSNKLDNTSKYQLSRSALSVMLNIAEASGRFTNPDKRKFYIIARGSLFETTALLMLCLEETVINRIKYQDFYNKAEELSKMLYVMIRNLESNNKYFNIRR